MIVCFTESGKSSGLMAKYRPQIPIWAFCPSEEIKRKTALLWGVEADLMESAVDVEEMIQRVDNRLLERSLAKRGDRIAIVFGAPVGEMGHTNSVRLHQVGRAD